MEIDTDGVIMGNMLYIVLHFPQCTLILPEDTISICQMLRNRKVVNNFAVFYAERSSCFSLRFFGLCSV